MTYRRFGALVASVGLVALSPDTDAAFAASAVVHAAAPVAAHPVFRPSFGRHHRGNQFGGVFWPGTDDFSDGPPYGGAAAVPPPSGDVHYTYTYDVPWDAVHRFPPNVTPSARPYVQECTAQTVTVPRYEGAQQTASVNILRCY